MTGTLPIPYGMGGVIPNALGGSPNIAGINNNLASLVSQMVPGSPMGLGSGGTTIPYGFGGVVPRALGGNPFLPDMAGFTGGGAIAEAGGMAGGGGLGSLLNGFHPSIPGGPASNFPRASLAEVPVSIRMGASTPFEASALGRIGAAAEGLGAEAAGGGGILSRIGSRLPMAEGVGLKGFARGAVGPLIASIALNKAGSMAGGSESFLGRALKGAGTGSIGFALGPEVGIPATILGAAFSALGGKPKNGTPVWLQDEVLNRAGFGDEDKAQIKLTYDILKETQGKDKANDAIGQLIMQDITTRQQQKQEDESSQRRMLATQALTAQFFQPFTKQMMDSAQNRYQISESLAKDLPPEYRSIMRANNVASLDNANRVATAYASQAQLIPQLATIDYQMNLANQLSQQNAAAVIQGMAGGGQSGSLTDLASQMALQGNGQAGG